MRPDAFEVEEHDARHSSVRCEPQQLLAWWAKLVHRILVNEVMAPGWENCDEGQNTSTAFEAPGLCIRPAVDSDASLCQHRINGAAIRLG